MANPFEGYARSVHQTVNAVMGETAVWVPSDGSAPEGITARVLFSNPTLKSKLNDVEYNPADWQMEFPQSSFPTLKELVNAGSLEIITVNGTDYYVKQIIAKWDGQISLAKLELK